MVSSRARVTWARARVRWELAMCALLAGGVLACSGTPTPPDQGRDGGWEGCGSHAECSDQVFCNGSERCEPGAPGANAYGCLAGPTPCLAAQACEEAAARCVTLCDLDTDADNDGVDAIECGGDDCDDSDPDRFPGNPEVCDDAQRDEDCDPSTVGTLDQDGDGQVSSACCNDVGGGAPVVCGPDCDDGRIQTYWGATEVCNGIDDDCDGLLDEGVILDGFEDRDFDGVGDGARPTQACPGTLGFSTLGTDCDDKQPARRPGQVEICDSADNDCDDLVDEGTTALVWYRDLDRDGFGDPTAPSEPSCAPPMGYALLPLDCDDGDATRRPGATELCNARDDDCDGRVDEDACTLPDGGIQDAGVDGGYDAGFTDPCEACAWRYACVSSCDDPVRLGAGETHTCAVTQQGNVYCWGSNYAGQIGVPPLAAYERPVKVTLPGPAQQVVAGANFTCARLTDGRAYCWGAGAQGQLGDGETSHSFCDTEMTLDCAPTPIEVLLPVGTRAVEIGAGKRFACARLDDGTVACWGENVSGTVGLGSTTPSNVYTPTRVVAPMGETGFLVGAISLSVKHENACVIRAFGQVWCWGQNYRTQLGDVPSIAPRPTLWRAGAAILEMSVGWQNICGVTHAGAFICMGDNNAGQLGIGATTPTLSADPVTLAWAAGTRYSVGGQYHRCVVGASKLVRCVGGDQDGRLGDGDPPPTLVCGSGQVCATLPVDVVLGPVTDVSTAGGHTCALATGGVYCWGPNGGGVSGTLPAVTAPVLLEGP